MDHLFGGKGNDTFEPMGAPDAVDGGEGIDTVSFALSPRPVTVDLRSGFATGDGADTIIAIENVIGSPGTDLLRGDAQANRFLGGGGGDFIEAFEGDDFLDGEDGHDTLDGGAGTDECRNGEITFDCEP
ncbi:MAG: hypothetical protein M3238_05880 [Actinomycetota bacterium]|nr:hypothetical protein [Actinomycetota bacterium]